MPSVEQTGESIARFGDPTDPEYEHRVDEATDFVLGRNALLTTREAHDIAVQGEEFAGKVQKRIQELRAEDAHKAIDDKKEEK